MIGQLWTPTCIYERDTSVTTSSNKLQREGRNEPKVEGTNTVLITKDFNMLMQDSISKVQASL
jgi:hypothetical protein